MKGIRSTTPRSRARILPARRVLSASPAQVLDSHRDLVCSLVERAQSGHRSPHGEQPVSEALLDRIIAQVVVVELEADPRIERADRSELFGRWSPTVDVRLFGI